MAEQQHPKNDSGAMDQAEQVRVRFEKMAKIRERGDNPYRNGIRPTALAGELHKEHDVRIVGGDGGIQRPQGVASGAVVDPIGPGKAASEDR